MLDGVGERDRVYSSLESACRMWDGSKTWAGDWRARRTVRSNAEWYAAGHGDGLGVGVKIGASRSVTLGRSSGAAKT